jgi:micrococcal nuclease
MRSVRARLRVVPALLLLLLLAVLAGGCGRAPADDGRTVAAGLPAGRDSVVRDVIDGDTIVVGDGEHVRLIGIDTPETRHPTKPVQCFGHEATKETRRLLPRGTRVRLVGDVEPRDRYGRTLAYVVRVRDGLFVNAALAGGGFARPLTIPPNVAHTDEFRRLAEQARVAGRGLWSRCGDEGEG